MQLARQVVDDRQFLGLQQQDVGAIQFIGRATVLQLFLDVAHRVVAKIAGQATAETRQARLQRHLEAALVFGDEVKWVDGGGLHYHAIGHHLGARRSAKPVGAQQRAGRQPYETVTPEALATHHRLQ